MTFEMIHKEKHTKGKMTFFSNQAFLDAACTYLGYDQRVKLPNVHYIMQKTACIFICIEKAKQKQKQHMMFKAD